MDIKEFFDCSDFQALISELKASNITIDDAGGYFKRADKVSIRNQNKHKMFALVG